MYKRNVRIAQFFANGKWTKKMSCGQVRYLRHLALPRYQNTIQQISLSLFLPYIPTVTVTIKEAAIVSRGRCSFKFSPVVSDKCYAFRSIGDCKTIFLFKNKSCKDLQHITSSGCIFQVRFFYREFGVENFAEVAPADASVRRYSNFQGRSGLNIDRLNWF